MAEKSVAIVGCGSLGSSVARLLAQAGVGRFIFIDSDELNPHNTARHALGLSQVPRNKALALSTIIRQDFPHVGDVQSFPVRFGGLKEGQLQLLSEVDVVVSAGIDIEGDGAVNAWRVHLSHPPIQICTWVEAFALAGHAIALFGKDSLLSAFDINEKFIHRLTDWPQVADTLITEAGCGNSFQPHGAVDLHSTVGMAASLILEVLLEKTNASCRRVWMGQSDRVTALGGVLRLTFSENQCIKEYPW